MVDFIKLEVKDFDIVQWRCHIPLNLKFEVDTNGEEVWTLSKSGSKYRRLECNLNGFKVKIIEIRSNGQLHTSLNLEGSLHKFLKGENYSQLTWNELQESIELLVKTFHLQPEKTKITNLEYGVNIHLENSPKEFLDSNLIGYMNQKMNSYDPDDTGKTVGYYLEMKGKRYLVKVYDKGLQTDQNYLWLLRFEIRSTKMKDIQGCSISMLEDLRSMANVKALKTNLIDRWYKLRFTDSTIHESELLPQERNLFIKGHAYLLEKRLSYKQRWTQNIQFKELIKKHGIDHLQVLGGKIERTWTKLFDQSEGINRVHNMHLLANNSEGINQGSGFIDSTLSSQVNVPPFHTGNCMAVEGIFTEFFKSHELPLKKIENRCKEGINCKVDSEFLPISSSTLNSVNEIESGDSKEKVLSGSRICVVTGIPLTGKAKHFLTKSMVIEIQKSDPCLFAKLRKGFCKNPGMLSETEVCDRIAHNVRNLYWNSKYSTRSKPIEGQETLF